MSRPSFYLAVLVVLLATIGLAPSTHASWRDPAKGSHVDYVKFVAPDGVTYPDFTFAGIAGGIPEITAKNAKVFKVTDYGADPADNGKDDTPGIQKAIDAAMAAGGGIVLLPEGHFSVKANGKDNPALKVGPLGNNPGNVVIRGAGRRKTILHLAEAAENGATVGFKGAGEGGRRLGLAEDAPHGAMQIVLTRSFTEGNKSYDIISSKIFKPGDRINIEANAGCAADANNIPFALGKCWVGSAGLGVDDKYGRFLNEIVTVEDLGPQADKVRLTLRQPLKIDLRGGSAEYYRHGVKGIWPHTFVRTISGMVERSGLENMTLTYGDQARNANKKWGNHKGCNGVAFVWAMECWLKGVEVIRPGRFPLLTSNVKFLHIFDTQFDEVEYDSEGGGTGYGGWFDAFATSFVEDCLMDQVESQNLRHDPVFQGNSAGNVIRNGRVFYASKHDYHNGPAMYNLLETTRLDQRGKAMGMFRSPQITATIHGPAGPGNVTFNNDYFCLREGMYIGGLHKDWIFNYNRAYVELGKTSSTAFWPLILFYDHVDGFLFKGNVFISPYKSGDGVIHYLPRFPEVLGRDAMEKKFGKNFYTLDGLVDLFYRNEQEIPADTKPYNQSRRIEFTGNTFYGFPKTAFFADPHPDQAKRPNGERYNRFDRENPPHNRNFFEVNTIVETQPHKSLEELRSWPQVTGWPVTQPFAPSLYAWQYKTKYGVEPWSPAPEKGPWNLPHAAPKGQAVNAEKLEIPRNDTALVIDGKIDPVWDSVQDTFDAKLTPQGLNIAKAGDKAPAPENLSGSFKLYWNPQGLNLLVTVRDDKFYDNGRGNWWEVDCVEVYVDGDNSKSNDYDGSNDEQIGLMPGRKKAIVQKGPAASTQPTLDVVTSAEGYVIEAFFPWETLGFGGLSELKLTPGQAVGFNIVLSDNDKGGNRQRRLSWVNDYDAKGGDTSHYNPAVFGTLILSPSGK